MKFKIFLLLSFILFAGFGCTSSTVAIMNDEIITEDHNLNKLHLGELHATSTSVDIGSGQTVYLKANANMDVHLLERRVHATTTGVSLDYDIVLYENGTDVSANNILPVFNVHRGFPANSTFNIYASVSGQNMASATILPFGNSVLSDKKFSSTSVSTTEYVLAKNLDYYLAITNNDGGVLTIALFWEWYEEE